MRQTEDIDILVNPSADNSRRWIVALSRLPDGAALSMNCAGSGLKFYPPWPHGVP